MLLGKSGTRSHPTQPKITFVYADDWVGIYIDGKLEHEGHSISPTMILTALGLKFNEVEANSNWLWHEELPLCIEDVVVEGQEYECDCDPTRPHD